MNIWTKIFEPFFTTRVASKGVGLGLSLTKKFVEDHDGMVSVESGQDRLNLRTLLPRHHQIAPSCIQEYDPASGRVPRRTGRIAIARHPVRTEAYYQCVGVEPTQHSPTRVYE